jgi:hypothetical protein
MNSLVPTPKNLVPYKPSREIQIFLDKLAIEGSAHGNLTDKIESLNSVTNRLRDTCCSIYGHSSVGKERIADAETLAAELAPYGPQLAAVSRPASFQEVRICVAALMACWPTANRDDAFGQILLSDIAENNPSIGAVNTMCRHLRHNQKFLPAISECLEILDRVEDRIQHAVRLIRDLPKRIADAKAAIPKLEEREKNKLEARQRAIDQLVECWRHGVEPSPMPSRSIVEDAKAVVRAAKLAAIAESS